MRLQQQMEQERIQRLTRLEDSQRKNIHNYLMTIVESAYYDRLGETVPKVRLDIRLFNFSVFQCKVKSWKLFFERTDNFQILCNGKSYQLRRQSDDLNYTIEACKFGAFDITLEVELTVAEAVREAMKEQKTIIYQLRIDWELELETVGPLHFMDYIRYRHVP